MKMQALVLTASQSLELRQLDVREPGPHEVLIRVKACGVCGTDLHMFHGDKGAFDNAYPLIMGHEFAGEVVRCGAGVTRLKPGDHVAVDPNVWCGECPSCLRGDVHFCENMIGIGTTVDGGFAEYCTVPQKAACMVPDSLPWEAAAMMEPVSCCLHGTDRSSIHPGDTVAVVGFGSIGNIIFQLAKAAGAARIAVIEPVAAKRAKALEMGAALALDPLAGPVAAALQSAGFPRLTTVIECVGRKETMELAVQIAGSRATVMLFGLTAPGTRLEILALEDLFKKELTITGSFINPLVAQRVIELLSAGCLNMDQVITDLVPLSRAAEVFTDPSYRTRGKIVIGDF